VFVFSEHARFNGLVLDSYLWCVLITLGGNGLAGFRQVIEKKDRGATGTSVSAHGYKTMPIQY